MVEQSPPYVVFDLRGADLSTVVDEVAGVEAGLGLHSSPEETWKTEQE